MYHRSIAATTPIAAVPASEIHGTERTLYTAHSATATTMTNGRIRTGTGCGSARGPSHQVAIPTSSLAFQTPASAKKAAVQAVATMICQAVVNCPTRGGGGWASGTTGTVRADGANSEAATLPAHMASADTARRAPFEKLSIFYPMWNEELYVARALQAGRRACENLIESGDIADYELIVVDDASTDSTGRLADEIAADDPHVRVVHHARNRKLGGAMKTGFAAATGDLILYTDADLPFDMAELPRAVRLMRDYGADIISAYRFDRTGEGYLRIAYTIVYNLLIRRLFGVKARDINFAFKLCRAEIFEHVELKSEGSFIDAELVIRATRLGYEMLQFGVDYFPRTRGESTLSSPGVILTILREMHELRGDLDGIEPVVYRD